MLPDPRGPLSELLLTQLVREPQPIPAGPGVSGDPLDDEDLHLALALAYELHNGGLDGVNDAWEWEPTLIAFRRHLERAFDEALTQRVAPARAERDISAQLRAIVSSDDGPSLSQYMESEGTPEQFAELIAHRSWYQLREADPHTWAIPRLRSAAKAAMVTVQVDEYGGGREERMHSSLFRQTMKAFELDTREGAYLNCIPGVTLATVNLMHMFGLQRSRRGAICGHLAVFEMTSTTPNLRYGNGLRRLGFGPDATEFFDEHVTADEVHQRVACDDLAPAVAADGRTIADDVIFGARALLELEARFARHLLGAWQHGATSLRSPLFKTAAV